jgi:anti-sigma B factor antagonist
MSTVILSVPHEGSAFVVNVSGDFDLPDRGSLAAHVQAALSQGATSVVVDLSDVTFFGSVGLSDLVEGRRLCRASGTELWLRGPSHGLLRILEVTGLVGLFPIAE